MSDGFFFLRDIVIVLGIGFVGAFAASKLRLPLLLGYLLGGFAFVGVTSSRFTFDASLSALSEIGVALLLFTLGIEFSFSYLKRIKNIVLWGGALQIFLTILSTAVILPNFGITFKEAIFLGSVFALSSTAVVVKILTDKGEINTFHGEILVGMLLLQDLAVIPLMILLPHILKFNSFNLNIFLTIILSILQSAGIILATFFAGRTLLPKILEKIVKLNSREILLLAIVSLALGFAFLASVLGLPPSIGAFLAGLLISQSLANHAIFSEVRPLRDIFSIIFFVLLGMFLSPAFFFANLLPIFSLVLFVIFIKFIIIFALMLAFSYHTRTAFTVSFSLTSVGEFAFIIAGLFVTRELISPTLYNLVLAVSLLTILITPWQIDFAPKVYRFFKNIVRRNPRLYNAIFGKLDFDPSFQTELPLQNHVVILGHGRVGKVISKVLTRANIPFVGVDYNLSVIDDLKRRGIAFVYGDPTDIEVLDFAQVDRAKVVVVAVSDRRSQEIIIRNALKLNHHVKIIVRSHFEEDKEFLLATGAQSVVQPEKEAGLTIAQKILTLFNPSS